MSHHIISHHIMSCHIISYHVMSLYNNRATREVDSIIGRTKLADNGGGFTSIIFLLSRLMLMEWHRDKYPCSGREGDLGPRFQYSVYQVSREGKTISILEWPSRVGDVGHSDGVAYEVERREERRRGEKGRGEIKRRERGEKRRERGEEYNSSRENADYLVTLQCVLHYTVLCCKR